MNDLPPNFYCGSTYFIKNKSVIQFAAGPTLKNFDIRMSNNSDYVTVIHINALYLDPADFPHTKLFDQEIITYNTETAERLANLLLKNKFILTSAPLDLLKFGRLNRLDDFIDLP